MQRICHACHTPLQCSCGTWDALHEGLCELSSTLCEPCWQREIAGEPLPTDADAPDPLEDYVKDLSDVEIEAVLVLRGDYYTEYDTYLQVGEKV